MRSLV